jgi:hypothetical protein
MAGCTCQIPLPADLNKFSDRDNYPGWFSRNIEIGNREQTIQFEDSFRKYAPDYLEAWFEVVFWKLYNMPQQRAKRIVDNIKHRGVSANDLWSACGDFTASPSASRFRMFQKLIVSGSNIAVCATFPAFIAPDRFPMVDSQVTRWVFKNYVSHNQASQDDAMLEPPPPPFDPEEDLLRITHYPFVEIWTRWCRARAKRLSELTSDEWRPRDVEMSVFTAQRDGLSLPLIP